MIKKPEWNLNITVYFIFVVKNPEWNLNISAYLIYIIIKKDGKKIKIEPQYICLSYLHTKKK